MTNKILGLAIFLLIVFKITAIYFTEFSLYGDEAQYWLWSQTLDLGYYSKPPLLAWFLGGYSILFGDSGDDDRGAIRYSHGSTDAMQFDTAAIERMRLTSTGNLCVGPSGSSAGFTPALTVTGTNPSLGLRLQDGNSGTFFNTILSADGNSIKAMYSQAYSFATAANDGGTSENARFTLDTSGNVSIDGNLSEGSDIRLKTNIEKIPDVLDVLNEIKPVKFEWKEDVEEGIEKKHIGLIAQEVEPHFPELIYEGTTRDTDDETYKGLNYAGLTPILLKSIQELSSKVNELQQKIEHIEKTCKCMKEE